MEAGKAELSTLRRGLEILSLFSEETPILDTSSIAGRMRMSKSTAYKYVQTLESSGFLVRGENERYFQLGPRLIKLTSHVPNASALVDASSIIMRNLVEATNETALLATIMGDRAVCLSRVESNHNLKLTYEIGTTYPLHAGASALVLLAGLDDASRRGILSKLTLDGYTESTITAPKQLLQRIEQIRKDGYAVSIEELDKGAFAVSAPVFSTNGRILASLSLCGPVHRFDHNKEREYIRLVREGARKLTGLVG